MLCLAISTLLLFAPPGLNIGYTQGKPQQKTERSSSYDPRALVLLREMSLRYATLTTLDMRTQLYSGFVPVGLPASIELATPETMPAVAQTPPVDVKPDTPNNPTMPENPPTEPQKEEDSMAKRDILIHHVFKAPNRFRLEIIENTAEAKPSKTLWISDGKYFWSYQSAADIYSKEKAPSKFRDFVRLKRFTLQTLEVILMLGQSPFENAEDQYSEVQYKGREVIRGIQTEVVSLIKNTDGMNNEMTFYIGTKDRLLHRMMSDTWNPVGALETRTGVGSALDELAEPRRDARNALPQEDQPEALRTIPGLKTRLIFENTFQSTQSSEQFQGEPFTYSPPPTARLLTTGNDLQKQKTLKQRLAEIIKAQKGVATPPYRRK